jgi:hypothetical protein
MDPNEELYITEQDAPNEQKKKKKKHVMNFKSSGIMTTIVA